MENDSDKSPQATHPGSEDTGDDMPYGDMPIDSDKSPTSAAQPEDMTRVMLPSDSDQRPGSDVPTDDMTRVMLPSDSDQKPGSGAPTDDMTRVMLPSDSDQRPGSDASTDEMTRVMLPGDSDQRPGSDAPTDEMTRVMLPGDSEQHPGSDAPTAEITRVMLPSDSEQHPGSDAPAAEITRVMLPSDSDQKSGSDASSNEITQVILAGDSGQRPLSDAPTGNLTRMMVAGKNQPARSSQFSDQSLATPRADVTNNPTMVDGSAERDVGKTVIKDRFVLDKILGAGGMGAVYKAKDLRKVEALDRNPWVAVKLLNEDFKTHPDAFMSLQREARKSQTLAHPNIIQVYDFDREGDMVYMTMELLEGTVLSEFIEENPEGVELDEAMRLTQEMGAALAHAHSHSITHADFKPGNVFVLENGTAKVLDFGIAQAVAHVDVEDAGDEKTAFDPSSLGALTPAYASLEMLVGNEPVPADDIYALGCIAYQLLSGKHPFDKMPADQAIIKDKRPAKIDKLNRKKWRALQKALEFKRTDRYQTVAEFLADFAPRANPWAKRLGVAIVIALVLGGVGIYQAVSSYYQEQSRNAKDLQREVEFAAETSRMNIQRDAKSLLDSQFSGLQADADSLESELDQHRFAFQSTAQWRQRMRSLLAQLAQTYQASDWRASLNDNNALDTSVRETLIQVERARRKLASETTSVWMVGYQERVAEDYLALASAMAKDGQFADARANISEAARLHPRSPKLLEVNRQLEAFVAVNRRENEVIAQSAREAEQQRARFELEAQFQIDDATIRADLKACTQTLSRTGRGGNFSYNTQSLASKTASFGKKYSALGEQATAAVDGYVKELGACIQLFGYSDPAAANEQRSVAVQSFPAYAVSLSALTLFPWDTCKSSFAGRGERYDCQDRFLGESLKGPILVVIPSANGIDEFSMSKYEITEQQFNSWCSATGACEPSVVDGTLPLTGRSVALIPEYVSWLSAATGFNYRLPTTQQWRYAAAAGGAELDPGRNCQLKARGILKGEVLLPVELGNSNSWGLVHHVGNARELVSDAGVFQAAGGSRTDPMDDCTVQAMASVDNNGDSVTGFRVVRTRE